MSELVSLIQQYLDRHGVRWAAFARNIGTIPQTVNKWKKNPATFPDADHLRGVARVTGVPYPIVLDAVLVDAGYRDSLVDDLDALKVRLARYIRSTPRGVDDIEDYLSTRFIFYKKNPDVRPWMSSEEQEQLIDKYIAEADKYDYASDEIYDRVLMEQSLADAVSDLEAEEPPEEEMEGSMGGRRGVRFDGDESEEASGAAAT